MMSHPGSSGSEAQTAYRTLDPGAKKVRCTIDSFFHAMISI
jgi:hypothetical protein